MFRDYKKKPVVVQAMKFNGTKDEVAYLQKTIGKDFIDGRNAEENYRRVYSIKTLEGKMEITKGDFVIKGIHGEYYPCKPTIFVDSYDPFGNSGIN